MASSELDFFNQLSGELEIELSEPPRPIAPNLLNVHATPEAKILKMKLRVRVYEEERNDFRELTPAEWTSLAFQGSEIRLRGESGGVVAHRAPNGKSFSVKELIEAVEETERQTRGQTAWFGGVDIEHRFFEGIHPGEDEEVWDIFWGS